jgi:hypothetical protein
MTKDEAPVQEPVGLIDRLTNPEQHYEFTDPKKANAVLMSLCQEAADALAAPVQEPVAVDQATMQLAESVGLIGPASRTHDLHAAIQRFHDLICVNATIKAAKMAADAIRESTPPEQPAVPDAFGTREGEHPQYIQGWNDCRAEMLRGNT